MKEHLLLFIDFLGTSDAVERADDAIIALLDDVASLRGEFDISKEKSGIFIKTDFRPEVINPSC